MKNGMIMNEIWEWNEDEIENEMKKRKKGRSDNFDVRKKNDLLVTDLAFYTVQKPIQMA